uniref:Uncharacterized protein n=1 Tax=Meloidogyne incognita TaxID=6306 RepID=A0A914LZL4_MELIC
MRLQKELMEIDTNTFLVDDRARFAITNRTIVEEKALCMTLINNNEDKFWNPSLLDAFKCLNNSCEFSTDSLIKIE